jgi:hypothetical protein
VGCTPSRQNINTSLQGLKGFGKRSAHKGLFLPLFKPSAQHHHHNKCKLKVCAWANLYTMCNLRHPLCLSVQQ